MTGDSPGAAGSGWIAEGDVNPKRDAHPQPKPGAGRGTDEDAEDPRWPAAKVEGGQAKANEPVVHVVKL